MSDLKKMTWSDIIVEELIRNGISYFCISPGSRSTPLTVAVARNDNAESVICHDERGSAFHALGYARATGKTAVIITTSGTAVANLYPAVIEAASDNIPMLILSADRPPELLDCGANQAIQQSHIFGQYTRWFSELPCQTPEIKSEFVLSTIDQAISRTNGTHSGPVHVNCMFREPLLSDDNYCSISDSWLSSTLPHTVYTDPVITCSDSDIAALATIAESTSRGMLFVGKLENESERVAVRKLIAKLNWPVYADLSSGIRLDEVGTTVFRYFDQALFSQDFNDKVKPDVVIHLGGRVTSKRVPLFFEQNRPTHFILIKSSPERSDSIHGLTMRIQSDVGDFGLKLDCALPQLNKGDFYSLWQSMADQAVKVIENTISNHQSLSEPFVARTLTEIVPENSSLFVSNSMSIRDVDIYGNKGRHGILVGTNRGASGIDGIMATASGFAAGSAQLTTLLIGDVAFLHDMNSLALIKQSIQPIVVVVVNNSGGGIFHFLPISKETDVFNKYFTTPHDYTFRGACDTFGLNYENPESKLDFISTYETAVKSGVSTVIEVTTDSDENLILRRDMKKKIMVEAFAYNYDN